MEKILLLKKKKTHKKLPSSVTVLPVTIMLLASIINQSFIIYRQQIFFLNQSSEIEQFPEARLMSRHIG